MANQEHLHILKQGVKRWNQWRREHQDVQPDFSRADLSRTNLSGANLSGTILSRADLSRTYFSGANLSRTYLTKATLSGATLCLATLSEAILDEADLDGADLSRAILSGAYLSSATLSRANLKGAALDEAHLYGANFSGADLSATALSEADLSEADLSEADLTGAYLSGANLSGAILSGAILAQARFSGTVLAKNDLSTVKGLVEIKHEGPSIVELHTVKLPQDGSTLHFLRGAGIPDEWIGLYRVQTASPIQYHSCFISYSSKDDVLARRLHADLQDHGVRCWFALEDMKVGDKIRARIDEAIHLQDKLLLLLSEHAIASAWIEDEVEAAIEKEQRQQREVLFPVRLDDTVMQTTQSWAAKLRRTRHIGDFTHWTDPQAYQQAFERLLRDLKAEGKTGG